MPGLGRVRREETGFVSNVTNEEKDKTSNSRSTIWGEWLGKTTMQSNTPGEPNHDMVFEGAASAAFCSGRTPWIFTGFCLEPVARGLLINI